MLNKTACTKNVTYKREMIKFAKKKKKEKRNSFHRSLKVTKLKASITHRLVFNNNIEDIRRTTMCEVIIFKCQ